jgi:5-formyltetrahydrofolate cyclo-ligase
MTPQSEMQETKAALRREVRHKLARMERAQIAEAGRKACEVLKSQKVWQSAQSILFYAPMERELDIWPLLTEALGEGRRILLPQYVRVEKCYVAAELTDLERDLRAGELGIREPMEHCTRWAINGLDLALVPGVAFDSQGRRLGRGKGYYDRLLSGAGGVRCGVAFDEQVVPEVPIEPHDIVLDCILTPTRWIEL